MSVQGWLLLIVLVVIFSLGFCCGRWWTEAKWEHKRWED